MPLSELYRMARGSLEPSQEKPTDLSHLPDNDEFVELVWENGQIMMQGQSSRVRRNTNPNNSQSQIPKFRDRDLGNTNNPKTGRYGLMGSVLDDFTPTVPSSDLDDEMAPWLNYNDPLHNNYCSDFLPALSSVTLNDFPHESNMIDKKSISHPTFNGNQPLASSGGFSSTSSGIINFSHFSRPVALARVDTRNANVVGLASSSGVEKTVMPTLLPKTVVPTLLPKTVNTRNSENSGNVLREDAVRNEVPPQQGDGVVASKGSGEGEKVAEPVVASSSVCSGNNPEQTSDDQNHNLKRKSRETDDSEGRSEDLEEESVGIRKAALARGGTGTKRSRAAEVHNLSERRRRDRINEKMRALQELIPNCNKVDKASMLDEAIEYLKTLQLQVQIMSMGAGMYMPHMMLPTGLQHVPGHMAHFPPMMGMGFSMGMMDMNGGARFHGPRPHPFSGPANFPIMSGPNGPIFGLNGPGFPVSMPCHPSVPISAGFPNPGANNAFGPHAEIPNSAPMPSEVTSDGFGHSPLGCKNERAPNHVSLAKESNDAPPS